MKYNREKAITETLKWEGGYSNDASDPGGPTNWGITIADVRKYINPSADAKDVRAISKEQAIKIYQEKYWKTPYYDCDNLASGVDLSVFDFGVNSGPSRAKKFLDKACGGTDAQTIIRLNDARLTFLQGLRTWPVFGKGWGRRVVGIKAKSLEMNKEKPAPSVDKGTQSAVAGGIIAATTAFITGHKALIIVAGAFILIGGILYYLERRKRSSTAQSA